MRGKGENARVSRGVRCKRSDFEDIFKKLRPSDVIPNVSPVSKLYKLQPCPKGASAEIITTWLDKQKIQARPLKALASDVWLIGASEEISQNFYTWNGQSIMVSQVQSKYQQKSSPVIAGKVSPSNVGVNNKSKREGGTGDLVFQMDPWANYAPIKSKYAKPIEESST